VRRLNRNWGEAWVPKVGWVRFRWSRDVPAAVRSFRVTRDRAGRWHLAFAVIPEPVAGPGTGEVVGIDRGVKVSAALSTGKKLTVPGPTSREAARLRGLQRKLARARRGSARRAKAKTAIARLNDGIRTSGWGLLVRRLEEKAPGRVEKVPPAYTSQRCSACGHVARENRESQAVFRCTACNFACNADVNAARNIAAGHAVKARGGNRDTGPVNREPQLLAPSRG
jgi:transposase